MGFFTPDTVDDALKQIGKMNSEMRAISALIHLNYNMIDGRNRDKIKSHLANAIHYADKYEKIKRHLSEMDKIMLLGDTVDVWNGERVGVLIWETYFRNTTSKLYDDLNY
ncbi:MAG: hypothetical protein LUC86_05605 [Prevotellaceae bacterium]|nr:hypothetical protein [Prevotellaceae bacterium]